LPPSAIGPDLTKPGREHDRSFGPEFTRSSQRLERRVGRDCKYDGLRGLRQVLQPDVAPLAENIATASVDKVLPLDG